MIEENIVEFCAPTLAGIKTANLFTCTYHEKSEIVKDIRRVNKLLVKRGIKALPARYSNHRVLIYVLDGVMANNAPDDEALENCADLGRALA